MGEDQRGRQVSSLLGRIEDLVRPRARTLQLVNALPLNAVREHRAERVVVHATLAVEDLAARRLARGHRGIVGVAADVERSPAERPELPVAELATDLPSVEGASTLGRG